MIDYLSLGELRLVGLHIDRDNDGEREEQLFLFPLPRCMSPAVPRTHLSSFPFLRVKGFQNYQEHSLRLKEQNDLNLVLLGDSFGGISHF